jgi:hypothetical protein
MEFEVEDARGFEINIYVWPKIQEMWEERRLSHEVEFRPLSPEVIPSCDRTQISPSQPHGRTIHALWCLIYILRLHGNRMGMVFYAHVLICGKSLFSHRVQKGFGTCDCQCVNDIHFRFVDKAEGSLPPSLRDFGIFTRDLKTPSAKLSSHATQTLCSPNLSASFCNDEHWIHDRNNILQTKHPGMS